MIRRAWDAILDMYFGAKSRIRLRYLRRKDPFIYK
jgi:hypothetical protein